MGHGSSKMRDGNTTSRSWVYCLFLLFIIQKGYCCAEATPPPSDVCLPLTGICPLVAWINSSRPAARIRSWSQTGGQALNRHRRSDGRVGGGWWGVGYGGAVQAVIQFHLGLRARRKAACWEELVQPGEKCMFFVKNSRDICSNSEIQPLRRLIK